MIPALIAAAIAGLTTIAKNDRAPRERQEAINEAEQKMWDQRNAEIQARQDAENGIDPRRDAFARQMGQFRDQVDRTPVSQDWTPLVQAAGTAANAIYGQANKPSAPAAPSGRDMPGQNFTPAGNYAAPVNYSEWQPVEHKTAAAEGGNYLSNAARRYEEEDDQSLPAWLR